MAVATVLVVLGPAIMLAQSSPVFEVASVRPCDLRISVFQNIPSAGERFYRGCASAWSLIGFAYDVSSRRLQGVPEWARTERFTVDARTSGVASLADMRTMVRQLLRERFAFKAHTERRETDAYHLVLSRSNRTLGPGARRAEVDCMPFHTDTQSRTKMPRDASGKELCPEASMTGTDGEMSIVQWKGMTATHLASRLEERVGRTVIDRTGLEGIYDFDIRWPSEPPDPTPGVAQVSGGSQAFMAALTQQLGLKLEPARAMVDVLVVDAIERPTPN